MPSVYDRPGRTGPRLFGLIDRLRLCLDLSASFQIQVSVMASRWCAACVYPVEFILDLLASGMSNDEILDDYADLELHDLYAALEYGARASAVSRVVRLGAA